MKANELRIGNLVGLNLEEFPENYFRMLEIADHACVVTDRINDSTTNIDRQYFEAVDLDAIPLNEEWLKRFGFEQYDDLEWHLDDGPLRINNVLSGFEETDYGVAIKFVHQLQNLTFALTGNELTLK